MRSVEAFSKGLRRRSNGFTSDAAGPIDEPAEEQLTIPPGHGSGEYDITSINGVIIAKFSFVSVSIRDVTQTGGSGPKLRLRLSEDGGSTWMDGASDYFNVAHDGSSHTETTDSEGNLTDFNGFEDVSFWLEDLNAEVPTYLTIHEMGSTATTPNHRCSMTLSDTAHDAIQIRLGVSSGTPVFTGGIIDIAGYR